MTPSKEIGGLALATLVCQDGRCYTAPYASALGEVLFVAWQDKVDSKLGTLVLCTSPRMNRLADKLDPDSRTDGEVSWLWIPADHLRGPTFGEVAALIRHPEYETFVAALEAEATVQREAAKAKTQEGAK